MDLRDQVDLDRVTQHALQTPAGEHVVLTPKGDVRQSELRPMPNLGVDFVLAAGETVGACVVSLGVGEAIERDRQIAAGERNPPERERSPLASSSVALDGQRLSRSSSARAPCRSPMDARASDSLMRTVDSLTVSLGPVRLRMPTASVYDVTAAGKSPRSIPRMPRSSRSDAVNSALPWSRDAWSAS